MNAQIEHCLYQAGLTAQGCWDELDDYAKEGIEKFAELIVEEVYDYILNATFDDEPWPSRKEVKQHFGVEE